MIARTKPMIAIVDDDESVRLATAGLVRSLDLDVRTFTCAEDFLSSPLMSATSCLITDVQMPGMDGLELHRVLVRRGYGTPVILITAFPEERLRQRAVQDGAVGFLSKPFDDQMMIGCLDEALQDRGGVFGWRRA